MLDIKQTNDKYSYPSIIYDTTTNNNLILFDDFSKAYMPYKDRNGIQMSVNIKCKKRKT